MKISKHVILITDHKMNLQKFQLQTNDIYIISRVNVKLLN